jgi:hypothetical protein
VPDWNLALSPLPQAFLIADEAVYATTFPN